MKVLTATADQQTREGDFCWTVEGELLRVSEPCDRDRLDPENATGGCGCSRGFSGLSSMKSTTTALVRDLDITREDVLQALHGSLVAAGHLEEQLDDDETSDLHQEVDWLLELASEHEVGTVLQRSFDDITERTA